MTVEQLAQISGVILALAFAYIPKLKDWYDLQPSQTKVGIMGGLLAAVALGAYGLTCAGFGADFGLGVTCDKTGAIQLVKVFVNALVANQMTYIAAVRPFSKPALAQGDV